MMKFLVFLLIANALFWGLASHKQHCAFASMFGIKKCPPHWIHVYVMGLGSFVLALFLSQGKAGLWYNYYIYRVYNGQEKNPRDPKKQGK